jgi:hypothetical protein
MGITLFICDSVGTPWAHQTIIAVKGCKETYFYCSFFAREQFVFFDYSLKEFIWKEDYSHIIPPPNFSCNIFPTKLFLQHFPQPNFSS